MIRQIKSFFKHVTLLDPQYSLNMTIVLLLSVVSFYTSFDGLRHYMFGNNTNDASWALLVLLAFLVFLIQLLLIVALMRLTQRISLSNKVSMLLLYMIAMGFSVFLSYSYWYQAIQADNYAYNNFNIQLDESLSDVGVYQDTFSNIKKIATELAEYSQETALLEKNRGKTCGDNSSPGAGPRLSLRNSEETLFTLMNSNISLLNDEVMQKINKLDSIRYGYSPDANIQELQKSMNIVIAEVNRYKQNPDLIKAKKQLKEHSGDNRETLSTLHNGGNRTVSCPDAIITQKSQLLLTRINDLPVLKNIRLFNSQDQREVMERALKVFLVIPSATKNLLFSSAEDSLNNEVEKDAEAVKSSDFTPLILGVMIDLIIFFVGYGNGKYSQQRNYLSGKFHGQHFSVNDAIKINHVFNIEELRENLQWYHHQLGRKHLIIIPSDTYRQSQNLNKRNIVSLMESLLANRRLSLQALRVPFDTLPKNMRRRFSNLPKDTLFEFYYATEEQWFDLLQSLEADEILTSKNTDPQDFVISTLEHHQVKKERPTSNTEESSLSLKKNVISEELFSNPDFDDKQNNSKIEESQEKAEEENIEQKEPSKEKVTKEDVSQQKPLKNKTPIEKEGAKKQSKKKEIKKSETLKEKFPEKETPQKETPQKETPQKETPQKETPQKETPQKETPQKETPQKETPQKETPQKETPQKETPQKETSTLAVAKKIIEDPPKIKKLAIETSKEVVKKNKIPAVEEKEALGSSNQEETQKNKRQRERLQKRMRQLSSQQHQRTMKKRGR